MSDQQAAVLVGKLTDVIAELQQTLGVEKTRKLLIGLARGLGKSEPTQPLERDAGAE